MVLKLARKRAGSLKKQKPPRFLDSKQDPGPEPDLCQSESTVRGIPSCISSSKSSLVLTVFQLSLNAEHLLFLLPPLSTSNTSPLKAPSHRLDLNRIKPVCASVFFFFNERVRRRVRPHVTDSAGCQQRFSVLMSFSRNLKSTAQVCINASPCQRPALHQHESN